MLGYDWERLWDFNCKGKCEELLLVHVHVNQYMLVLVVGTHNYSFKDNHEYHITMSKIGQS